MFSTVWEKAHRYSPAGHEMAEREKHYKSDTRPQPLNHEADGERNASAGSNSEEELPWIVQVSLCGTYPSDDGRS